MIRDTIQEDLDRRLAAARTRAFQVFVDTVPVRTGFLRSSGVRTETGYGVRAHYASAVNDRTGYIDRSLAAAIRELGR